MDERLPCSQMGVNRQVLEGVWVILGRCRGEKRSLWRRGGAGIVRWKARGNRIGFNRGIKAR